MENIIKELKEEYVGKEITLLELDNEMQEIADKNSWYFNSIFAYATIEALDDGNFFFISNSTHDFLKVEFNISKLNNENLKETVVKVTNIDLM